MSCSLNSSLSSTMLRENALTSHGRQSSTQLSEKSFSPKEHSSAEDIPEEPEPHQFLRKGHSSSSNSSSSRRTSDLRSNRRSYNKTFSSTAKSTTRLSSVRRYWDSCVSSVSRLFTPRQSVSGCTYGNDNMFCGTTRTTISRRKANNLRDEIRVRMILGDDLNMCYVPNNVLNELLNEQTVLLALAPHRSDMKTDVKILTRFICSHARRLFATLIWCERVPLIDEFYTHNFADNKLPVHLQLREDQESIDAFTMSFNKLNLISSHPFGQELSWSDRELDHFCNLDQWCFLSPVFYASQFRYEFDERVRLPVMDKHYEDEKESFFSVVRQWRIHRAHLQIQNSDSVPTSTDSHPFVAIKELKRLQMSDVDFEALVNAEIRALEMMREIDHPHLIKAIAYYKIERKHYVMFPWAEKGNLRDFWKKNPPKLNSQYFAWVFTQLCGLAGAIERLHHSRSEGAWRHGDLKPENVLCFDARSNGSGSDGSCLFVIADVGLAKGHDRATEIRMTATRTHSGTIMYEPPEAEIYANKPRSRRYDVWSMGCIYLEFIIWLLYGSGELGHFRGDLGVNAKFYVIKEDASIRRKYAELSSPVLKWVEWIRKDPRCPSGTAIRQLLELVITRLLVADVSKVTSIRRADSVIHEGSPPRFLNTSAPVSPMIVRSSTTSEPVQLEEDPLVQTRATAEEMNGSMVAILRQAPSSAAGWMKMNAARPKGPGRYGSSLDPLDENANAHRRASDVEQDEYRFTPLDDDWSYSFDATIAQEVFSNPALRSNLSQHQPASKLCSQCCSLEVWRPSFSMSITISGLKETAKECEMCHFLLQCIGSQDVAVGSIIEVSKTASSLFFSDRPNKPAVSIYTLPFSSKLEVQSGPTDVQPGFPKLPEPNSPTHTKLLASWIRNCNDTHTCLPPRDTFLPTRVLEVGYDGAPTVRLFCDTRGHTVPGRYLALSHRWGSPEQNSKFCTLKGNYEQFQDAIEIRQLPQTFQDAIAVTRSLDVQYLWIDSLCIIQDDYLDWERESRLMEQVYSSAYITIAATRANGAQDGFLKPLADRKCVTIMKGGETPYFLCEAIDNFDVDVDQGELNKRGWVLQERALSRRTVYFAEKQTYWECGQGVRCETLTRMNNRKASFLGDPDFPNSVEAYVKGMKIQLYQSLYEKYSNLALSFEEDRPIAIKGLEVRLLHALKTRGGHGIFDLYLHRCLLWHRAGNKLKKIQIFRGETISTWSWMAYTGGIRYLDVPFGAVNWSEDIVSPFQAQLATVPEWPEGNIATNVLKLAARASNIVEQGRNQFILDEPERVVTAPLKLAVLGTSKSHIPTKSRFHYCLIISHITGGQPGEYERVGVAVIEASQLKQDKRRGLIRIC